MTNADRCPDCGKVYALVGYKHLCVPKSDGGGESRPAERQADDGLRLAGREKLQRSGERGSSAVRQVEATQAAPQSPKSASAGVATGPSEPSKTYRYRDPEKWREYMRGYMKAYRARKA